MASKYVLVCQNADCMQRGSGELFQKLTEKLKASGDIEVKPYMCFGGCQAGPNIVLYPQKVWYSGVKIGDLEDIAANAEGGYLCVDRFRDLRAPDAPGGAAAE